MIVCIGLITYGVIGFNLMYPGFKMPKMVDGENQGGTDIGFFKIADEGFGFLLNGPEIASAPEEPVLKDNATPDEKAEYEAAIAAYPDQVKAYNDASTAEGYEADYTKYADFFFQAMFAATCCTIVSGAVAGRVKLGTFLIFCFCLLYTSPSPRDATLSRMPSSA